jgi:tRNA threonylcarbamoyladenosine biosynthesis protein TsaE
MKKLTITNISQLAEVANYIKELSRTHKHFCFEAEMGAGKTTAIKKICEAFGVEDYISSPTYSIVNEYVTKQNQLIYHFDLYRLNSEIELLDIGIEEILDSDAICFIEWPEKIINFLSTNYVRVNIKVEKEIRLFTIEIVEV